MVELYLHSPIYLHGVVEHFKVVEIILHREYTYTGYGNIVKEDLK
jgi:hypothetical protein